MMRMIIVLAALAITLTASSATTSFPSVRELQAQLNLHPGDPLPKLIVWMGHPFQPRYVRAEARSNGEYAVIIKLDR